MCDLLYASPALYRFLWLFVPSRRAVSLCAASLLSLCLLQSVHLSLQIILWKWHKSQKGTCQKKYKLKPYAPNVLMRALSFSHLIFPISVCAPCFSTPLVRKRMTEWVGDWCFLIESHPHKWSQSRAGWGKKIIFWQRCHLDCQAPVITNP